MASITLEYNARNNVAKRIIEIILSMDKVFKVKTYVAISDNSLTCKAIRDADKGNIVTCETYEDYLKHTARYA